MPCGALTVARLVRGAVLLGCAAKGKSAHRETRAKIARNGGRYEAKTIRRSCLFVPVRGLPLTT